MVSILGSLTLLIGSEVEPQSNVICKRPPPGWGQRMLYMHIEGSEKGLVYRFMTPETSLVRACCYTRESFTFTFSQQDDSNSLVGQNRTDNPPLSR